MIKIDLQENENGDGKFNNEDEEQRNDLLQKTDESSQLIIKEAKNLKQIHNSKNIKILYLILIYFKF